MRIAVACDGLSIAVHFVQCSSYMCYTVLGGVVVDSRNVPAIDRPVDQLPEFFRAIEADVLMTGSIDESIVALFEASGLRVVEGFEGDPLTCVRAFIGSAAS